MVDSDLPTISSSVGDLRSSIMRLKLSLGPGQSMPLVHLERVRSMRAMLQSLVHASLSGTWVHNAMANDFIRGLQALEELEKLEGAEAGYQDVVEEGMGDYDEARGSGYYGGGYDEGEGGFLGRQSYVRGRGGGSNALMDALLMAQHSLALLVVHHSNSLQQELASCQERLAQAEAALSQVQADKSELLAQYAAQGTQLSELIAMEALLSGALSNAQAMLASLTGGTPPLTLREGSTPLKTIGGFSCASLPGSPASSASAQPAAAAAATALAPAATSQGSSAFTLGAQDLSRGSSRLASPCASPAAEQPPQPPPVAGRSQLAPRRHSLAGLGTPPTPLRFEDSLLQPPLLQQQQQQQQDGAALPQAAAPHEHLMHRATAAGIVHNLQTAAAAAGCLDTPPLPPTMPSLPPQAASQPPIPPAHAAHAAARAAGAAASAAATSPQAVAPADAAHADAPLEAAATVAAAAAAAAAKPDAPSVAPNPTAHPQLRPLALLALPAERAAASILNRAYSRALVPPLTEAPRSLSPASSSAAAAATAAAAAGRVSGRELQVLRLLVGVVELDRYFGQVLQGSYGIARVACGMAWSSAQLLAGALWWPAALLWRAG